MTKRITGTAADAGDRDEQYERVVSDRDLMNDILNKEVAELSSTALSVGDSVVLRLDDSAIVSGVIVDDYGDLAGHDVVISDGHVARSRRWAVETVEMGVVFADDDQVEHVVPQDAAGAGNS